jgi:L-serine dehydratase
MFAYNQDKNLALRCTNLGGLSITSTAKRIEAALEENPPVFFKNC